MKAILISIKPKYVADILNGEKTIEIRKTMPKCDLPIDVYIYVTRDNRYVLDKGINDPYFVWDKNSHRCPLNKDYKPSLFNGKVVAKFTLRKIKQVSIWDDELETETLKPSCLDFLEFDKYTKGQVGYAWHIDNLEIFRQPKELSEFKKYYHSKGYPQNQSWNLTKAPQSWCYVEEI